MGEILGAECDGLVGNRIIALFEFENFLKSGAAA